MEDELPLESSQPSPSARRKTSVYMFWLMRFRRVLMARKHDDDKQKDLARNVKYVRLPPASGLIKSIKSWIVRSVKKITDETSEGQLQEQQKRCSKYSQKALMFAITMFVAYLGSSSAPPSTGSTAVFKFAMAAIFVAIPIDLLSITRAPKWGYVLVYLSWLLLVLLSYLLLVSFHKDYGYAIIPVPLLLFGALLHRKLRRPSLGQENPTSTEADQDLEDIFDMAAAIVNCGGLISMILGHYMYMVGPDHRLTEVSVIGFMFFFTVVLGLYLMMAATVRNAALTCWASRLYYLLGFLLVGTLIATVIVHVL